MVLRLASNCNKSRIAISWFVSEIAPEGYVPAGWTPPVTENNDQEGAVEFRARDMLRTPQFYMLWTVFMFEGISGLMVIYCIKLFGIDALGPIMRMSQSGLCADRPLYILNNAAANSTRKRETTNDPYRLE